MLPLSKIGWLLGRTFIGWSLIGQRRDGNACDLFSIPRGAEETVISNFANHFGLQIPTRKDSAYFFFAPCLGDDEHAFLRFREQQFVGRNVVFTSGNGVQV